jgi:hypothetical protein
VGSWCVDYVDNRNTGDYDLIERYDGQVTIEKNDKSKYLGFVISDTGDNMVNIKSMKDKSIEIIRQTFNRLERLNLRRYYFDKFLKVRIDIIALQYLTSRHGKKEVK